MGAHHTHHHDHQEASSRAGRAFRWSIALNTGLTTLQLAIGFGFGSLALIGDALHNLGDVIGLVLGWGAKAVETAPSPAPSFSAAGQLGERCLRIYIPGVPCPGSGSIRPRPLPLPRPRVSERGRFASLLISGSLDRLLPLETGQ